MNVAELKAFYEKSTGSPWDADKGVLWLCQNREKLDLYFKTPALDVSAHITLSDKANWLSQQYCRVCNPTSRICTVPARIRPESWQALNSIKKGAFKAAIRHRLGLGPSAIQGRICLTFLFVCSSMRRRRDLDNMAKLLMDAIKGVVMEDDTNVDHLNLMRLDHEGDEEYVLLQISGSDLNDNSNVVDSRLRHSWGGMELLSIENFRG